MGGGVQLEEVALFFNVAERKQKRDFMCKINKYYIIPTSKLKTVISKSN